MATISLSSALMEGFVLTDVPFSFTLSSSTALAPPSQGSLQAAGIEEVRAEQRPAECRSPRREDPSSRGNDDRKSLRSLSVPITGAKPASARHTGSKLAARRRPSRYSGEPTFKSRPIAHQLLLPLLYAAFILLHLLYWLYSVSHDLWRTYVHREPSSESLEATLLRIGSFKRAGGEAPASGTKGIRIPRQLALAMPLAPSSPSPGSLLQGRVSSILRDAMIMLSSGPGRGAWVAAGARQLPPLRAEPQGRSQQDAVHSKPDSRKGRAEPRAVCIDNLVKWAALAGVEELSVWDEREEITRWLAMRQGAPSDITTTREATIDVEVPEAPGCPARRLRVNVGIRDGERRMLGGASLDEKETKAIEGRQDSMDGAQSDSTSDSESDLKVEELKLVLNVLTPRYDGREAFAGVSQCIASNIRQELKVQSRASTKTAAEDVHQVTTKEGKDAEEQSRSEKESQDARQGAFSASQQRWIQRRLSKVGVAEVDDTLKRSFGLPCSEPDLLIVCTRIHGSPSGHARGGSKPALTLGEFPRWLIRITEIFHCCSVVGAGAQVQAGREGAAEEVLTVHDFWAALEQFSKAEQRNGR